MVSERLTHLCRLFHLALPAAAALALAPSAAVAQPFELAGGRARGMAGAFVAVADDASATWWNPAGLPGSLFVDVVVDGEGTLTGDLDAPIANLAAAAKTRAAGVAVALPMTGLSYRRWQLWGLTADPAAPGGGGRQDDRTAQTARRLAAHTFGFSLAQSVGDALVIGVTARVIRGTVAGGGVAPGDTADRVFDRLADAEGHTVTRGDLDAGALLRAGRWRFGVSGRNLAAPRFADGSADGIRLERRARAGVAFVADADRAGRQPWVVSLDADLTRDEDVPGTWRGVALGAERRLTGRLTVRGGVQASTSGDARPAAAGGFGLALPGGLWIEAAAQGGGEASRRGWTLAAHLMF
ncbi:MAG TPA: conjugal transfer protein TraF [Vicinamibacterales bacterium]